MQKVSSALYYFIYHRTVYPKNVFSFISLYVMSLICLTKFVQKFYFIKIMTISVKVCYSIHVIMTIMVEVRVSNGGSLLHVCGSLYHDIRCVCNMFYNIVGNMS